MNGSREAVPALRIEQLRKRYGSLVAVDDVSLRVAEGDFFGFLGPNGAGKTTTINAVVGLARIDRGTIEIFGHDNQLDWRAARRLVGLAPQEYNFDRFLSIRDVLIYQAGYYGVSGPRVRRRADELLERFGLTSKSRDTYVKLSGGMKRRLTLARALVHEPRLLILDEPTAGVDVELRLELWEMLRELNEGGTTIILTTHYLEEAESMCRNIAIVEAGRIVAMDSTAALLAKRRHDVLSMTLSRPLETMPPGLAARNARYDPATRTISLERLSPADLPATLALVENAGYELADVDFKRASLQDIFLDLTAHK